MRQRRAAVLAGVVALLCTVAARGTTQRTFVASTGLDTNPCTRDMPCRSFSTAIAATSEGGEVIVLDSAGYGAAIITQSVALISPSGVYAGISAFSANAVTINAPSGVVILEGLTMNGLGAANGIELTDAAATYIEDCVVSNFSNHGLEVIGGSTLFVKNTTLRRNGVGVYISPPTVGVMALFDRSHVDDSTASNGFSILPAAAATVKVTLRDSTVVRNPVNGIAISAGGAAEVNIQNCTIAYSGQAGVGTFSAGSIARVSQTMVTGNYYGFWNFAGTIVSFGNNQVRGNTTMEKNGAITVVGQD